MQAAQGRDGHQGPRTWPTSRPHNVADFKALRMEADSDNKAPRTVAEIDDVHIDSAAAAECCIEGGTCIVKSCKLSKLPKATTPSKSTRTDELSEGACAACELGLRAHNDKKSGLARLARFTANALNSTLDTGAVGELNTYPRDREVPLLV